MRRLSVKKLRCVVLTVALLCGGCAWQRGQADKKTLRQSIYELWKTKPERTTCLDFHNYMAENKKFLDMNGFRLCYVEKGEGDAVLLLHGLFSSKDTWRANFMPLAEHFRTIAIDEPGSGDSDNPHQSVYRYNPEHLAETTAQVMDRLDIKEAHLVGNSLGGMISLQIARDHPERVKSLVLIAPAVWDYYGKIVKAGGLAFGFGPALATARPTAEFGNALLDGTVYNKSVLTDADRYDAVKSLMQNGARNALIEKSRELFNEEYLRKVSETFTGLKTRTLIIWGEEDGVLPPLTAHRLYEQLPNSEILFIPFCGHHPQEEVPRIMNEELLWFLSNGKLGARSNMRRP